MFGLGCLFGFVVGRRRGNGCNGCNRGCNGCNRGCNGGCRPCCGDNIVLLNNGVSGGFSRAAQSGFSQGLIEPSVRHKNNDCSVFF